MVFNVAIIVLLASAVYCERNTTSLAGHANPSDLRYELKQKIFQECGNLESSSFYCINKCNHLLDQVPDKELNQLLIEFPMSLYKYDKQDVDEQSVVDKQGEEKGAEKEEHRHEKKVTSNNFYCPLEIFEKCERAEEVSQKCV